MAEQGNEKTLAHEVVGNVWVSTVRLSVDHGFGGEPLWYETMVFDCDADGTVTNWLERDCERYATADEALAGHAVMVAKWRDNPEDRPDA